MLKKICLAGLAMALVTACEQAQVNGPVGGGLVSVTELQSGALVLENPVPTSDEAAAIALYTQESWDGFNDFVRLSVLGINQFADLDVDDNTWYVLTISGGMDYDSDRNFVIDMTPVTGSVNAIVKGSRLEESEFTVSAVTEAIYQRVRDQAANLSDAELQSLLDESAVALVGDVDESGSVDYEDALKWNYLISSPFLQADISGVAAGITQGISQDELQSAALVLFGEDGDDPEAVYASSISDIVQTRCGPGCHLPGGSGSNASAHDLTPVSNTDHVALNVAMYRALVQARSVSFVVSKGTGTAHGGGAALRDADEIAAFEDFLNLL